MTATRPRSAPYPPLSLVPDTPARTPILVAVPPLPGPSEGGIPDPSPAFVGALAVRGYEVVAGSRTIAHLGPHVSVGCARRLATVRALRVERRLVYRDARVRTPIPATVRIQRPDPVTAEAAVVLRLGGRALAVALSLEWTRHHWQARDLTVL